MMNNTLKNLKTKVGVATTALTVAYVSTVTDVFAASNAGEVTSKINSGLRTIQTVLTAVLVIAGLVTALWIVLKKLPVMDDPHEKNQAFRSLGTVLGWLALGMALTWLVPWIAGLFQ